MNQDRAAADNNRTAIARRFLEAARRGLYAMARLVDRDAADDRCWLALDEHSRAQRLLERPAEIVGLFLGRLVAHDDDVRVAGDNAIALFCCSLSHRLPGNSYCAPASTAS